MTVDIQTKAEACARAAIRVRELADTLQRHPINRRAYEELHAYLEEEGPRVLAAYEEILTLPVTVLELEVDRVSRWIADAFTASIRDGDI